MGGMDKEVMHFKGHSNIACGVQRLGEEKKKGLIYG